MQATPSVKEIFYDRLTPDNAALLLIDYQTGLMLGVGSSDFTTLKNNSLALASLLSVRSFCPHEK